MYDPLGKLIGKRNLIIQILNFNLFQFDLVQNNCIEVEWDINYQMSVQYLMILNHGLTIKIVPKMCFDPLLDSELSYIYILKFITMEKSLSLG